MKTQKEIKDFLNIIKKDDLPSFFVKYKNYKNVAMGHFPLLSILYLYNAKKLIKKYEKELTEIKEYQVEFEPFDLYKKFREVSGKSLRLYYKDNTLVLPIEMLAILNEDYKVKKLYNNSDNINNIETIYLHHNQNVKFNKNNIKISKKSLKSNQKSFFFISCGIILSFVAIISVLFIFSLNLSNKGTELDPKKIFTQSQLSSISHSNQYFTIEKDISLSSNIDINSFSGTIDGKNNTITLNYTASKSLFTNFSGTLKNLKIVYKNENQKQKDDFCLIVSTNNGIIENINLDVECCFESENKPNSEENNTSYISLLTKENNGTVKNCTAKVDLQATSVNSYDNYLCVFASINNNIIDNCVVLQDSIISTQNIDVSSICITNNLSIENCKNYANITENATIADFGPLVGGICLHNYSEINSCFNYGNLSASNLVTNTVNLNIMVGGIAMSNTKDISNCINYGNITSSSINLSIYAGGICAYAYNNNSGVDACITNCGSVCSFNIQKENNQKYIFCGGIVGFFIGNLKTSYSGCFFENANDVNNNYFGLIIGCTYGQQSWMNVSLYFSFENVVAVSSENAQNIVAAYEYYYGVKNIENLDTNGQHTIYESIEQLKQSEVYWHE